MDATMRVSTERARRIAGASTLLGAVAWLALVAADPSEAVTRWRIERWVALAVLVYVPAGVWLVGRDVGTGTPARPYVAAAVAQPVGAACAVASAFVPSNAGSAALAGAWVVVTGLLAAFAVLRARRHGFAPLSELLVDAGFAYAVVGAVALVLARLDVSLVFRPVIIHLTAIHYHYAGFVLPVVAGLTGRFVEATYPSGGVRRQVFRVTGATILAGMVVIAVGITASPVVEVVSVVGFTVAVAAFAVLSLSVLPDVVRAVPGRARGVAAALLVAVASAGVVATMAFAVGYGWSAYTGETVVSLSTMVVYHGTVNALAFAACGLAGWALVAPDARARSVPVGFSPLRSRWRVGADYPERTGTVADGDHPPGQLDDLDDLAAPGFEGAAVDRSIRRFYERTGEYALSYDVRWHRPFRTGARLAAPATASVEQLNLPAPGSDGPHHADGRIVGVEPTADPREDARFWVRTDGRGTVTDPDAESVFVAAYATHDADAADTDAETAPAAETTPGAETDPDAAATRVSDGGDRDRRTYVNVGLPLPASNLTAILEPSTFDAGRDGSESGDGRTGLALTSRGAGDAGLYLATALAAVRVPMHERFRVWAADAPDAPAEHVALAPDDAGAGTPDDPGEDALVAVHEMWTFDSRFLTVRYAVYPSTHADAEGDR